VEPLWDPVLRPRLDVLLERSDQEPVPVLPYLAAAVGVAEDRELGLTAGNDVQPP
jgi:hypothetical protein